MTQEPLDKDPEPAADEHVVPTGEEDRKGYFIGEGLKWLGFWLFLGAVLSGPLMIIAIQLTAKLMMERR